MDKYDVLNVLIFGVIPVLSVAVLFCTKRKLLWIAPWISTALAFSAYSMTLEPSIIRILSNNEWRTFLFLAMLMQFGIAAVLTAFAYLAVRAACSHRDDFEALGGVKMKKRVSVIVLALILLCAVFAGILYCNYCLGILEFQLESDIRGSQKIQEDWTVDGTVSDAMAAFISYPQDKSDHTYSVYVNRPGLSFGYFFRGGGDIAAVEEYISEFTVEGCNDRAFISMNTQQVDRLEIEDGNELQVIDIDSDKPFAIVLPVNAGNITFFGVDGRMVEYVKHPL